MSLVKAPPPAYLFHTHNSNHSEVTFVCLLAFLSMEAYLYKLQPSLHLKLRSFECTNCHKECFAVVGLHNVDDYIYFFPGLLTSLHVR